MRILPSKRTRRYHVNIFIDILHHGRLSRAARTRQARLPSNRIASARVGFTPPRGLAITSHRTTKSDLGGTDWEHANPNLVDRGRAGTVWSEEIDRRRRRSSTHCCHSVRTHSRRCVRPLRQRRRERGLQRRLPRQTLSRLSRPRPHARPRHYGVRHVRSPNPWGWRWRSGRTSRNPLGARRQPPSAGRRRAASRARGRDPRASVGAPVGPPSSARH